MGTNGYTIKRTNGASDNVLPHAITRLMSFANTEAGKLAAANGIAQGDSEDDIIRAIGKADIEATAKKKDEEIKRMAQAANLADLQDNAPDLPIVDRAEEQRAMNAADAAFLRALADDIGGAK